MKQNLLLLLFVLIPVLGACSEQGTEGNLAPLAEDSSVDFASRGAFDQLDQSLNDGNGFKTSTNERGLLGWAESYVIHSYVRMYQAHRDLYYLDKLIDHADHMLASRDSELGVTDYRGLSLPAWSSNYGWVDPSEPLIMAVQTGNIVFPMISFVRLVHETPQLYRDPYYKAKADEYLQAVEDAVAVHDFEWRDIGSDKGTYVLLKGQPHPADGVDLPYNMNHALGNVLIELWALTGNPEYHDKVVRMAQLFKDDLRVDENGAYVWNYYWTGSWGYKGWTEEDEVSVHLPSYDGNPRIEDISHANISIRFAELAFRHNLVFNGLDMERFAKTFTENVVTTTDEGQLTVHSEVDGTGPIGDYKNEIIAGSWMPLAYWDETIFTAVQSMYEQVYEDRGFRWRNGWLTGTGYLNRFAEGAPPSPSAAFPPKQ